MPHTDAPPTRSSRWPRFSLWVFLCGIAAVAALLGLSQALFYVHPAHKFPAYEKAPYTSSLQKQIGPNTIQIRSIARNRYDGKIHLMNRSGLSGQIPNPQQLKDCAKWLDVVQFEITPGPELLEIMEVRVFDHETRDILAKGYGWQLLEPNLIQVYGLGKEVPEKLDLWLRVNSRKDGMIYKLPPTKGASVKTATGTITVSDITAGFTSWSANGGFSQPQGGEMGSAVEMLWEVDQPTETVYQVATVGKSGQMEFNTLEFQQHGVAPLKLPFTFDMPLASVDHYQVGPPGQRQPFFFDGVEVPPATGRKFDPPPVAIIRTDQGESEGVLSELSPLVVRYQLEKGSNITGSAASGSFAWIMRNGARRGFDKQFGVIFNIQGMGKLPLAVRLQDNLGGWNTPVANRTAVAFSSQNGVIAYVYPVPLDEVQKIEITPSFP